MERKAYISEYYCGACGWPVSDHDSYCPECGGAFRKEDATERTCKMIPFVEEDGSVFIVNCSECGDAIFARGGEHGCNYCPNCGAKIKAE